MKLKGRLYLLPSPLSSDFEVNHIPEANLQIMQPLRYFIVEEIRNARRFLRKTNSNFPIDDCQFFILSEHSHNEDIPEMILPLLNGMDMGLISGAGLPCIADPGQSVVKLAHKNNIEIIPLTGPSSIMLSLMASGFNGQNFIFHGYLPQDKDQRGVKLKEIEKASALLNQTQIFIEAPYRNRQMLESLIQHCHPETQLCIAVDIHSPGQKISTATIKSWSHQKTEFHKKPAVFLLYCGTDSI
ncbi:MAG: SAM-dependent methyltransferase [Bacteroidales bacterium]|nr:SAM-dependent methyltransferase [Bacteroidales bacterium]